MGRRSESRGRRPVKGKTHFYYHISPNVLVYASVNELCPGIKFLLIPSKITLKQARWLKNSILFFFIYEEQLLKDVIKIWRNCYLNNAMLRPYWHFNKKKKRKKSIHEKSVKSDAGVRGSSRKSNITHSKMFCAHFFCNSFFVPLCLMRLW